MVGAPESLDSRRIVLTGASRGLGRALALAFRQAGADLLLIARHSDAFERVLVDLVQTRAGSLDFLFLDLADTESAAAAVRDYAPDVLVNNAAQHGPIGPLWTLPLAEWQRTLALDLATPAALMAAAIPAMIERRSGVVINMSGGGATASRRHFSAYAAAKAGLVRLTECIADEVRAHGISVTAVAPGAMPSRLLQEIVEAGPGLAGADEVANAERVLALDPREAEAAIKSVTDFCLYLAAAPRMEQSGRLVAPRCDDWSRSASSSDLFKLRRIEPAR
jgi:3-oxoacyl-[acyl-carrier protein] reductase